MKILQRMARGWRAVLVAYLVVTLLSGWGAALAQTNMDDVRLIAPSGPYAVGRTAYQWTDEARPEVHTDDEDDRRALLVEVWYPADPAPDAERGRYIEPPMGTLFASLYGAEAALAESILANAYPEAPLSGVQAAYPVVVFSPGYSIPPRQYSALLEELASYGYVVFGVSHPYVTGMTILPDGRVIPAATEAQMARVWNSPDIMGLEFERVWVPDVRFVLDQIARLHDDDPAGRFTGRLALEHGVGLVGHSQGARTVTEVCLLDDRCAAAINLDGQRSARADLALDRPYLMVMADRGVSEFAALFERGFEGMSRDLFVIMIPRSTHGSPFDLAFTGPLMIPGQTPDDLRAGQQVLVDYRVYLRVFLDRFLKGEAAPLLDGPSEQFPEVFIVERTAPIRPATEGVEPREAALGPNFGALDFGQADVWTYEGQAGEALNLWVMADRPANDADQRTRLEYQLMDTLLVVYGPDGAILAANDDVSPGVTDSMLARLELPRTGKYWIVVRTWQGDTAGQYTLLIDSLPGDDAAPPTDDSPAS